MTRPDSRDAAGRRRLFFALWPDDPTRSAVSRASGDAVRLSGGRPTAKRNLHVTVAFLGSLDEEAQARAASVPPFPHTEPFELVLDELGYFEHSRTLWLGPSVVPPELTALEQQLWQGLEDQGFEREPRVYRPHLTLARRAHARARADAPARARADASVRARTWAEQHVDSVRWSVTTLTLVESISLPRGVHYEPLEEWAL